VFASRRRHTRSKRDWSSDVCSSDLRRKDPDKLPDEEKDKAPAAPGPRAAKPQPAVEPMMGIGEVGRFIRALHRRWALEEAEMRRSEERRVGKERGGGVGTEQAEQ